jgi:GTP cyclohydrolase II
MIPVSDLLQRPPGLFERDARAEVARAIAEFAGSRPVLVARGEGEAWLACPVDGLDVERFDQLRSVAGGITLALSRTRASALDASEDGAIEVPVQGLSWARVRELADGGDCASPAIVEPATPATDAALELAKLARLLPAVLMVHARALAQADISRLLAVQADEVAGFRAGRARALQVASRARIPLPGAPACEFIVFRDDVGSEWTAIRIGDPAAGTQVPVRMHSACLTGDAFGSLRCDCGDQLRMAIAAIQRRGGGYLFYLDQEGCGIGLSNKMRAYCLQDAGLDTIDANTSLGFERDERDYTVAARMLQMLGISSVALLTNNPAKLDALEAAGIVVAERIPLLAPVGGSNRRYLEAKRQRAGHLLEGVSAGGARPAA